VSARWLAAASVVVATGCASAPKDAGFGDVQRVVGEHARQPLTWDPSAPIVPSDDAAIAARLVDPIDADQAVEIAFAHNRDLQATLEDLGIARAELLVATTLRNPVFHIESRFIGDPKVPIEVGLVQTLVDFISRGPRKRLGQAQFEIARTRVAAAVVSFAAEVRSNFYDLVAARRVLARHQTILQAQEASAELAQRQHAAGNIEDLDLENEQARYEAVKLEHARVQLAELSARERVFRDLGLAGPVELKISEDFPELPAEEPSREEIEKQALARRLDLQIARGQLDAAAQAAGVARTEFLDELTLGVHYEREPDGKTTAGPELELPIPIFDRGSPARQRAQARVRQAQQRYLALSVNARSLTREAYEALLEARSRAAYIRDVVVPRRQRILQLSLVRYNAMLVSPYDLLQARQNVASAEREQILATRDYWRARIALEAALAGVAGFAVERQGGQSRRVDLSQPASQQTAKEH
jgi:cobalt-zinc-cadmium efflux system outer membrane protein